MSYDYSENILVQESTGHLLVDELGWQVELAYNQEILGKNGTFGRSSYKDILLVRYFQKALRTLNPWITDAQVIEAQNTFEKIKAKISELDHWTDKQETKAEVDTLIGKILWEELPESYSDSAIFEYRKLIFEYVFMRYKQVA